MVRAVIFFSFVNIEELSDKGSEKQKVEPAHQHGRISPVKEAKVN